MRFVVGKIPRARINIFGKVRPLYIRNPVPPSNLNTSLMPYIRSFALRTWQKEQHHQKQVNLVLNRILSFRMLGGAAEDPRRTYEKITNSRRMFACCLRHRVSAGVWRPNGTLRCIFVSHLQQWSLYSRRICSANVENRRGNAGAKLPKTGTMQTDLGPVSLLPCGSKHISVHNRATKSVR